MVLKSQILAGGRGLGKFTNGLQGGVHICNAKDAVQLAKKMLGGTLVTKQTGPAGKPVNVLYVAKKDATHEGNVLCSAPGPSDCRFGADLDDLTSFNTCLECCGIPPWESVGKMHCTRM